VCAILPAKAVSGGTLNPTHSLTHSVRKVILIQRMQRSLLLGLAAPDPAVELTSMDPLI